MMKLTNVFMDMALKEAAAAAMRDEVPVGAVIIHGPTNRVIARDSNLVAHRGGGGFFQGQHFGDPVALGYFW